MDRRFTAIEASVDKRFVEAETRMDKHFSDFRLEMHGQISGVRGEVGELRSTQRLQSWMLALLVAGMLLPVVERLAGWL